MSYSLYKKKTSDLRPLSVLTLGRLDNFFFYSSQGIVCFPVEKNVRVGEKNGLDILCPKFYKNRNVPSGVRLEISKLEKSSLSNVWYKEAAIEMTWPGCNRNDLAGWFQFSLE